MCGGMGKGWEGMGWDEGGGGDVGMVRGGCGGGLKIGLDILYCAVVAILIGKKPPKKKKKKNINNSFCSYNVKYMFSS